VEEAQVLQTAQETIRQGNREAGRKLLAQLLRANPRNETAWLWLSAVVDDPEQERECVQRALRLKDRHALQEAENPR
jgi:Tfp pilus assembly protein PilF